MTPHFLTVVYIPHQLWSFSFWVHSVGNNDDYDQDMEVLHTRIIIKATCISTPLFPGKGGRYSTVFFALRLFFCTATGVREDGVKT